MEIIGELEQYLDYLSGDKKNIVDLIWPFFELVIFKKVKIEVRREKCLKRPYRCCKNWGYFIDIQWIAKI